MKKEGKSFVVSRKYQTRSIVAVLAASCVAQAWAIDLHRLNEIIDHQNSNLPAMVAKDLRQERVRVSGSTVIYRYTHLSMSAARLRDLHLEVTQRPYIYPRICQDAATGRMLREGISFRYVYVGNDGGVGGELQVKPSDCM